jgi:hypothetical protein
VKVVEIKRIEDCTDGSLTREILLDAAITKDFILYLGKPGKMQYFKDFPRPFFKINADGIIIKGIQDTKHLRIVLLDRSKLNPFTALIENYNKGGEQKTVPTVKESAREFK